LRFRFDGSSDLNKSADLEATANILASALISVPTLSFLLPLRSKVRNYKRQELCYFPWNEKSLICVSIMASNVITEK